VLALNPYEGKKLLGDLSGSYSYRLTYRDRIVYSLDEKRRIMYIERAKTHNGE
jgi:Txe/YoeB family toxin of Txe-Axe toxin-antitoxin module